ncbi:MAG TPA: histidinol-phosphate transaminase [Candidatus Saccharimonadales bacterium]|jgi:histidinol-phosphate/aromatic aminotransferase/cobyric acid decarboxylase-like protein|nr:histidinol-phosphate transaminase [Candidatus Saccharimonadales bacterium]
MSDTSIAVAHAFHGGRFFEAIGTTFNDLAKSEAVISADVLDAWFDPSPRVIEKLREHLPFLARTSPPAHGDGLIETIAEVRGISPARLCLGGGSSHLIFTCLPALTNRRSRVMVLDPMYGEYAHVLEQVLQLEVTRHCLREDNAFRIDTRRFIDHARRIQPHMVVIVNPNSPTGRYWPRDEVLEFLRHMPDTLCLVDETYIDYVHSAQSLEPEVGSFDNLLVLKSLSKIYALSGLRAAYLAAPEPIVRQVARLIAPWSVSLPAQVAAIEALHDPGYYQARYRETDALRFQALESLCGIEGIELFDSCANFYLIKTGSPTATSLVKALEHDGIFIRHCGSMSRQFHDNYVRLAVKRKDQNERIVRALQSALARERVGAA